MDGDRVSDVRAKAGIGRRQSAPTTSTLEILTASVNTQKSFHPQRVHNLAISMSQQVAKRVLVVAGLGNGYGTGATAAYVFGRSMCK